MDRARRFAMHAIDQVNREQAALGRGRGRYTLWTGHIGAALYLRACLDVVSDFPSIETF